MYLSIPCIPPTTSKEKKLPKSVVLVHKSVLFEVQDVSQICEGTEGGEQSLN